MIRIYIEAPDEDALQQAIMQAGVDYESQVRESHYTQGRNQPFTLDFRQDAS